MHETNAARAAGEAAEPSATGSVAPGPLRAPLWIATAVVALAGLAAEVGEYRFAAPEPLVELFSLSYEANVPTWYATVLLFACSALLATIARAESITHRTSWSALAAIFAYMSLDEAIQIHEHLAWLVPPLGGVLHFGWVVPASVITLLVGLAFLPFLRSLAPPTRWRFVLAGTVYVGGALVMELPLGWWADTYGDDNLGYGVIDFVEESMELTGASIFLLALHDERRRLT